MQNTEAIQQHFSAYDIIEGLIQQLGEKYVFPDKAQEIAVALREQLVSGVYADLLDGNLLAQTITEHLQAVGHDKHLRLFYQADGVQSHVDEQEALTPEEVERMRQNNNQNYGLQKLEIMEGNIGYFRLNEFAHPGIAGESMQAAMTFLTHTRALIIDLRTNGGGEAAMVQFLCSYFFDAFQSEYIQLNGLYDRRKNLLQQFWVLSYVPGSRYLNKPLYVLTSQRTFSGAEEFTYNLQQLKRALVIGETTGGGAHAGMRFPIAANFEAFIPTLRAINPLSGTNWEGTGVQPDVPVAQEEALAVAYQRALAEA